MDERRDRVIRASEIGRYVYCARAWWLGSVQGWPSARWRDMAQGTRAHQRHGRRVRAAVWMARLGYALLALALVVAITRLR